MGKPISQLNMLSPEEYRQVIHAFNNTAVEYPREKCIHTLFEEQVEMDGDKTAVIACDAELSYREINDQANRIAYSLITKGVLPGDIVAFILPRRSYLLSVMFGILKSGAAYMPIDPDYPQDRIDYMLIDSGAKLCITEENLPELLANENRENPAVQMTSDSLCYCIYTSGSTGKPKGTALSHRNAGNYCNNNNNNNNPVVCEVTQPIYRTIASVTTVGFDIFATESIMALANGLTVILANEEQAKYQKKFNELLLQHPADILQTTPTKMRSLIANRQQVDGLKACKVIILGGEVLDEALVLELSALTTAKIFNIYGPTETTVWATNALINAENSGGGWTY